MAICKKFIFCPYPHETFLNMYFFVAQTLHKLTIPGIILLDNNVSRLKKYAYVIKWWPLTFSLDCKHSKTYFWEHAIIQASN